MDLNIGISGAASGFGEEDFLRHKGYFYCFVIVSLLTKILTILNFLYKFVLLRLVILCLTFPQMN